MSGASPDRPSVAAVVINYNGGDSLLRCIQSVLDQSYRHLQCVVVDNASSDGSLDQARRAFPRVTFIENGCNAGWGVGCNVGIQATASDYIALMNNDAYLDGACVERMVSALEQRPEYGSCASRILLWDAPATLEVAGISIYRDGSSVGRGRLSSADAYPHREDVFCANDCCCLYRRAMIRDIGLYDPDFFIYCDETDMGWRHQIAGWKCIYEPDAVAYHAHSRAAGSYSDFKLYHVERNRIYICLKYFPVPFLAASAWYAAWRYALHAQAAAAGRGALARYRERQPLRRGVRVLLRAHRDAMRKSPIMWRRRREIRRLWRISGAEFAGLFRRFGISARQMANYE